MDYDDNLAFNLDNWTEKNALVMENEHLRLQNRSLTEQLKELKVCLEQATGPKRLSNVR
jgi:regulator of replication initiation timing